MPVSTKSRSRNKLLVVLTGIAGIILVTLLATYVIVAGKQADTIGKYELLELIDNQACRYLDKQPAVKGSFDLDVDAEKDKPKLTYLCLTGEKTGAKEIHGKQVPAYDFGASVQYFSSNEEAIKIAEQKLNPLRYWGVYSDEQMGEINQNAHFTFIVTDVEKPYFDAYTVKANAILRVSLPCADADPAKCDEQAREILDREMSGINVL